MYKKLITKETIDDFYRELERKRFHKLFLSNREWFIVIESPQDISEHFSELTKCYTADKKQIELWQDVYNENKLSNNFEMIASCAEDLEEMRFEKHSDIPLLKIRDSIYGGISPQGTTLPQGTGRVDNTSPWLKYEEDLYNHLNEQLHVLKEFCTIYNPYDLVSPLIDKVFNVLSTISNTSLLCRVYRISPVSREQRIDMFMADTNYIPCEDDDNVYGLRDHYCFKGYIRMEPQFVKTMFVSIG